MKVFTTKDAMKSLILAIVATLTLLAVIGMTGCSEKSKEYKEFVDAYGSETRTYCKDGFKMRETFMSPEATVPQVFLIDSQDCK